MVILVVWPYTVYRAHATKYVLQWFVCARIIIAAYIDSACAVAHSYCIVSFTAVECSYTCILTYITGYIGLYTALFAYS